MCRTPFLAAAIVLSGWLVAHVGAADTSVPLRSVWDGVFTTEQASRGKAQYAVLCGHCHSPSLAGSQAGPPLKGSGFWKKWQDDTLWALFVKIRDYMPEDTIESVSDAEKLDILTHILVSNDVPPGNGAVLTLDRQVLNQIVITKDRGAAPSSGNFWEVRVAGCLVRRPGGRWALDDAGEVITASNEVVAGSLALTLYNTPPTLSGDHLGHVVHAQGLVFRRPGDGPGDDRLSVASLEVTQRRCAP